MTMISKSSVQSKYLTLMDTEPFASGHESRDGQVWLTFRYIGTVALPPCKELTALGMQNKEALPVARMILSQGV